MDGGRFPTEPWNGESENSDQHPARGFAFLGEGTFLWFVSFVPAKEMNSRTSAKALDLERLGADWEKPQLSPEGESLSLLVQRK